MKAGVRRKPVAEGLGAPAKSTPDLVTKRYSDAFVLARNHLLPTAAAVFVLERVCRPWDSQSKFARAKRLCLLVSAAILFVARPMKLCLRLLLGQGLMPPDAPGRLPVLGHMLAMLDLLKGKPRPIWDWLTQMQVEIGRTFRLIVGPECAPIKVMHMTSDPANVEHILKSSFDKYGKGQEVEHVFDEFLGTGIFVVDGERWRTQRKTAASIFSKRNFSDNMIFVFQAHARRLVSVLDKKRISGHQVNLQDLFFALTLDAFCEIGFGFPWNSMEGAEEDASVSTSGDRRQWAHHFDIVQSVIVTRFAYRPLWRVERFLARSGLLSPTHPENQLVEGVRHMNSEVDNLLEQRFAEAKEKKGSDLLSLFMEITQDRAELRDIIMNFVIAGRDTTACTLTWLFWELARCPQACAKARDEVLHEAAKNDNCEDFTYEMLGNLKYCTACVRETVRFHPPVPVDPKVAFEDDVLPDGTLVSKGEYVLYGPFQMARDHRNWGSDAAVWRPERWLEIKSEPSPYVNCAFQAGPRICLGRDMALLEAKAVLAQVFLAGLRWDVEPRYNPVPRYPSIVLPMRDPGLPVRVSVAVEEDDRDDSD